MTDVLVLCYHAVSPSWTATLSVTPQDLREQLELLTRRGWRGATFTQAVLRPPWPRTLAVTFDDAFLSVLRYAEPILSRLGLPGTVFAPTAFISERQPLRWRGIETADGAELTGMDCADLAKLAALGWEIGSHSRSHARLTELDDASLEIELRDSKRELEAALGAHCDSVAYPYGAADQRVIEAAARAGYLCGAWLSSSLRASALHRWPRVGVYHGDRDRFRLKVNRAVRAVRASPVWPAHE